MDEYGSISYEKDIVPLQRKFFSGLASNPKISREALSSISNSYSDKINNAYMQQAKLAEADQMLKSRALNYETTKLQLEEAREEAYNRRNSLTLLKPISDELSGIQALPSGSQRNQALTSFALKNAQVLATDKAADLMYRATAQSAAADNNSLTVADVIKSRDLHPSFLDQLGNAKLDTPVKTQWFLGALRQSKALEDKDALSLLNQKKQLEDLNLGDLKIDAASADFDIGSTLKIDKIMSYANPQQKAKFKKATTPQLKALVANEVATGLLPKPAATTTATPASLFSSSTSSPF